MRKLFCKDSDLLDDLTQEALVRLHRFVDGGQRPQNLDALMNTMTQRTFIDFVRRDRVRKGIFKESGDESVDSADPGPGPDDPGDPLAMIEFVVMEFFRSSSSPCLELARQYFDCLNWNEVARSQGKTRDAIAKQWSRCVEVLRQTARLEGSVLWILGQDLVEA